MSIGFMPLFERAVSKARLTAYRTTGGASAQEALRLYMWNTALCEALYPALQVLEVGFRNSAHAQIARLDPNWLVNESGWLRLNEMEAIREAKREIIARGKMVSEDRLVETLRFGFWTSLLDSHYETLWHKLLAGVFPHMPKSIRTRKEVSRRMQAVRNLRNAVVHHHSIWNLPDLAQQHNHAILLIGFLCSSLYQYIGQIDRFPVVLKNGPVAYAIQAKTLSP